MKTLRIGIGVLGLLLIGGGYFASQAAMMSGLGSAYAYAMDAPAIRALATVVLVGSIVLAFLNDSEVEAE